MLNTTIYTTKHAIKCFSCREPDGDNVEFLVNGRTEDSITYKHDTGDCTHHNGECHPDECSCNANMFQHAFHLELKNNSLLYTCEMLFTDSFTNAVFSKHISILFKEKGKQNPSICFERHRDLFTLVFVIDISISRVSLDLLMYYLKSSSIKS